MHVLCHVIFTPMKCEYCLSGIWYSPEEVGHISTEECACTERKKKRYTEAYRESMKSNYPSLSQKAANDCSSLY